MRKKRLICIERYNLDSIVCNMNIMKIMVSNEIMGDMVKIFRSFMSPLNSCHQDDFLIKLNI
jgi:hypothetical protein